MAAEENAFARIMNRLSAADTSISEKTAAVTTQEPDAAAKMLSTVRSISSAVKTAAAPAKPTTPTADLARMAKEAKDAEQSQMEKEAQLLGASVCDGFMARYAQYDAALSSQGVKTASVTEAELNKVAQAAYSQAIQDMEKKAEQEFNSGYNDQMQELHKVAADIHYIGQQTAQHLVSEARKTK